MRRLIATCALALAAANAAPPAVVRVADRTAPGAALPTRVTGRAAPAGGDRIALRRQWPGSYFETAFRGRQAFFKLGAGDVVLQVSVDGRRVATLRKPAPGLYQVDATTASRHVLRIDVSSESQAGPSEFGGYFAGARTRGARLAPRRRQIEFIGDSHTVGYANESAKQDCTQEEVFQSTDTTRAFGALVAKRYDADYQVNAISGRGVVRNYNGFEADPLPIVYPFVLFDKAIRANQPQWQPDVIVIALGTNDFTTPLRNGEKWKDREALHADFEATYVAFVRGLRARNPHAFFILWATDKADGEIEAEVSKVARTLRAAGETRLAYVPIDGLSFAACHSHPSLADDARIATMLTATIERQPKVWHR